MDSHLLEYIEIKDFKCFKDFKAEGFKRVNLIGGKNNVGKTAFMEACYINLEKTPAHALIEIVEGRYMSDFFTELVKEVGLKYILKLIDEKAVIYNGATISSNIKNMEIDYIREDINKYTRNENIMYMNSYRTSSFSLDFLYSLILEKKLETEVDKALNLFDNNIDSFRIIKSEPKCSLKSDGKFYNLNELGDGIYRYITYLCLFYGMKKSTIFIDEIDTGIHYTQFDRLWEVILAVSQEQNVQVFATTHSKECIESYARVTKKLEDKEICYIKMSRLKDDSIKAGVRDFEMLQDSIDDDHEVRGW